MKRRDAVDLLDGFVRYAYNVELDEFKELYPGACDSYLLEKFKYMQKDLGAFFGELDTVHRLRLVDLIVARHKEKNNKVIPIEDPAV